MIETKHIYFCAYAFIYIFYGALVTAVGPIIPYFSKITGEDETYYSFIFLARAAGYVTGGIFVKQLIKMYHYHALLIALLLGMSISLIISSMSLSFFNLTICMFFAALCACSISIITNLCIFKIFIGDRQDFWIQLIHTVFGIGGLVGPFLAIQYEEKGMLAIGILILLTMIPFFFLKSPEVRQDARKSIIAYDLSKKAEIYICLLLLFYVAEEVGLASWIPTYAIKTYGETESKAGMLSSMFWITNTAFRIILLKLPGTVTYRLRILLRGLVLSTCLVFVLQSLEMYKIAAHLIVFTSGMFIASMYALFLAISFEHGFKLSPTNTANAMMSAALGEGLLIMPIGYAMGYFGPHALILIVFIFSISMYFIFETLNQTYERDLTLHQLQHTQELLKKQSSPQKIQS